MISIRTNEPVPAVERRRQRAQSVGLTYIEDHQEGIFRRRCGRGFTYLSRSKKTVKCESTRARIESLVIPPAWVDVWICPDEDGHIQALGTDEAGRTQYIYHPRWQQISSVQKFDRMEVMAEVLPRIRRRVRADLGVDALPKKRVVAAVVRLLDKAHLRVGNARYAQQRDTRGATTLQASHVEVEGFTINLEFPGKSGKLRELTFSDRKTAQVIDACADADGDFLFCYQDDNGDLHRVTSIVVNDYLKDVSGQLITAKDFRTWWGSVVALCALGEIANEPSDGGRKKAIAAAVAETSQALGNTPAVCRSSYIHPGILSAAQDGTLPTLIAESELQQDSISEMTIDETRLITLLPFLELM